MEAGLAQGGVWRQLVLLPGLQDRGLVVPGFVQILRQSTERDLCKGGAERRTMTLERTAAALFCFAPALRVRTRAVSAGITLGGCRSVLSSMQKRRSPGPRYC